MVFHPREGWQGWGRPRRRPRSMGRREFLRLGGGSVAAAWLVACGANGEQPAAGPTPGEDNGVRIGTPDNPVTQPLFDDNPMIESDLEPEDGPLRLFNWADYIWPRVLRDFEEEYGVEVELTTFYNLEQAVRRLRAEDVPYDVFFPTGENIPRLIAGKLLQPLNHDYLPNLEANIWPMLADPFYDQGSRYTVPYAVYQTGIGWRTDQVDADIEAMENPWEIFWDTEYAGITGLYDDYRETIGVGIYSTGSTDINSGDPDLIAHARDRLIEAVNSMNMAFSIDGAYVRLPEGRLGLQHAWSGDMAAAPYYAPEGDDPSVLRFMWPPKHGRMNAGYVSNDSIAIPSNAENPVLAHHFLNYMLDEDAALKNFSWVLYQPPQNSINPEDLVTDEYIPENVATTVIQQEDYQMGQIPIQLTPEADARWLEAWSQVQAGG